MTVDVQKLITSLDVAILIPMGISGGALVQSLLDNHPQVIHFPGNFSLPDLGVEPREDISPEEAAREFLEKNPDCFSMIRTRSDVPSTHSTITCDLDLDLDAFLETFRSLLAQLPALSDRSIFLTAHVAFAMHLGRDPNGIRLALVHIHYIHPHLQRSLGRVKHWPNRIHWLLTVRDPREYIASSKKRHAGLGNRTGGTIYGAIIQHLALMEMVDKNVIAPRNCQLVDLATLHGSGEKGVTGIAKKMGLIPHSNLLESSFCGKPWLGNAANGKPIAGLDPKRSRPRYKEQLEEWEIVMAEYLLKPIHAMMRFHTDSPERQLIDYISNLTRIGRLWPERFPWSHIKNRLSAKSFNTGMRLPLPLPFLRLASASFHLYIMYVQSVLLPFTFIFSPRMVYKRRRLEKLVAENPFPKSAFLEKDDTP